MWCIQRPARARQSGSEPGDWSTVGSRAFRLRLLFFNTSMTKTNIYRYIRSAPSCACSQSYFKRLIYRMFRCLNRRNTGDSHRECFNEDLVLIEDFKSIRESPCLSKTRILSLPFFGTSTMVLAH